MNETVNSLYYRLEQLPNDWKTRTVLVDALLDAGEDNLAEAHRWMLREGRRAIRIRRGSQDPLRWSWENQVYTSRSRGRLPSNIFQRVLTHPLTACQFKGRIWCLNQGSDTAMFNSLQDADRALADALKARGST